MWEDEPLIAGLARHAPTKPARADPLWIAYEAGRREARRAARRWQGGCGAVALLAVAILAWPRTPRAISPMVLEPPQGTAITQQPTPPSDQVAPVAGSPDNVIALRDAVLERGLDALPRGGSIETGSTAYGVRGLIDLQNGSMR